MVKWQWNYYFLFYYVVFGFMSFAHDVVFLNKYFLFITKKNLVYHIDTGFNWIVITEMIFPFQSLSLSLNILLHYAFSLFCISLFYHPSFCRNSSLVGGWYLGQMLDHCLLHYCWLLSLLSSFVYLLQGIFGMSF